MSKAKTLSKMTVRECVQEALSWTNQDIRNIEDISPNLAMLKARRKVLRAALAKSAEGK